MSINNILYPKKNLQIATVLGILLAIFSAINKGNSLDEFWTLAFSNSRVPWHEAFSAWSRDSGHPIGYYFLSRLLDPILPDVIAIRRLSNAIFIIFLLVFLRFCKDTRFVWFFTFIITTQIYIVERFSQYRATFGALIFLAILLLSVREDWQRNRISPMSIIPGIALTAAMLLDYPVGLAGVATCSAWLLAALASQRRKIGAIAAGNLGLGIVTMAAGLLNSNRFPLISPPYNESTITLFKDTAIMVAIAAAPLSLPIAINFAAIRKNAIDPEPTERLNFLMIISLALAFTIAGYFAINWINHGMIRRQLTALSPLTAALTCEIYSCISRSQKPIRLRSIAILLPLLIESVVPFWLHTKTEFDTFGEKLAAAQQTCPTLPIYGVRPDSIGGASFPNPFIGIADPVDVGLQLTAKRHGFHLSGPPYKIDSACGAIIWTEFYYIGPGHSSFSRADLTSEQIAKLANISVTKVDIERSHIEYVDQSFILVFSGYQQSIY